MLPYTNSRLHGNVVRVSGEVFGDRMVVPGRSGELVAAAVIVTVVIGSEEGDKSGVVDRRVDGHD